MNSKTQMKAQSREKILQAASDLFRRQGFTATGVDELMESAGLTAGAFYAHFKSKQDLFDQSIEYARQKSLWRLTAGLEGKTGADFVAGLLKRYVSAVHRDRPEIGCVIPAIASEIARHSKKGNELIAGYVNDLADLVEKNLEGHGKQKREQALRILAQAVGAVLLSRLVAPGELSDEILRAGQKLVTDP